MTVTSIAEAATLAEVNRCSICSTCRELVVEAGAFRCLRGGSQSARVAAGQRVPMCVIWEPLADGVQPVEHGRVTTPSPRSPRRHHDAEASPQPQLALL